jgi:hypothetical protein
VMSVFSRGHRTLVAHSFQNIDGLEHKVLPGRLLENRIINLPLDLPGSRSTKLNGQDLETHSGP